MPTTEASYSFGDAVTVATTAAGSDGVDFRQLRDIAFRPTTGTDATVDIWAAVEDVDASYFDTGINIDLSVAATWVVANESIFPFHWLRLVDAGAGLTIVSWIAKA